MRHSDIPTTMRTFAGALGCWLVCVAGLGAPATTSPAETVQTGAMVWMAPESPYYEAGLRSGDLITEANGEPIRNDADFYRVFAATTDTAQIDVQGLRQGKPFRASVPAYLPKDVRAGGYGWDWVRYLKYYAPNPAKPDPILRRGYEYFDRQREAHARVALTSATARGCRDPLTLTKLAWLVLPRRRDDAKSGLEKAGELLQEARYGFDATKGDRDTEAKIEGTLMLYYDKAGNSQLASAHGRKAIDCAPHLIGNRVNYCWMLIGAKEFHDASRAANKLAADYPRSEQFQELKKTANERAGMIDEVIHACQALIEMTPENLARRLQILPYLDQMGDTYRLALQCEEILRRKGPQLTKVQRAEIKYYQGRVHYRRRALRQAQSLARQATQLRGGGNDYHLLGDICYERHKWRDAVVAYHQAQQKGFARRSREDWREFRARMDEAIDHLWSWQVNNLPEKVKPYVLKRKEWLKEREVLKHSFVMRNRYQIRNALIVVGLMMILTGVFLRMFATNY